MLCAGQGARAAIARAGRIVRQPEWRSTFRGMAYTPWLTVSVGLVIAAMVTLAVPHPAITLPFGEGRTCSAMNCKIVRRIHRDPAVKRGVALPSSITASPAPSTGRVEVEYAVLAAQGDRFLAAIEIRGRQPLGNWTLRFVLPGGTMSRVLWQRWAASGHGVIVYGSAPWWRQGGGDEVRLLVFGTGAPGWPTGCVFNGAACSFRALR